MEKTRVGRGSMIAAGMLALAGALAPRLEEEGGNLRRLPRVGRQTRGIKVRKAQRTGGQGGRRR